ncbi:MAG: hypothetical protein ACRBN8_04735 [Nannocystales bacterium]
MDLTNWTTLDTTGQLRTATYRFPGGVSRTTLVQLSAQRMLVYSPGAPLVSSAAELLDDDVELLLVAPSSGHTLGISPWLARFPTARVFAAPSATERLQRVAGSTCVEPASQLSTALPPHVALHTPPASRTGELWLSAGPDDRVYWIVCDSYMNIAKLADGFWLRLAQRLYGLRVGLSVGRAFRLGVGEPAAFREWAVRCFANGATNVLVPCHGEVDERQDLTERLIALTKATF